MKHTLLTLSVACILLANCTSKSTEAAAGCNPDLEVRPLKSEAVMPEGAEPHEDNPLEAFTVDNRRGLWQSGFYRAHP